MLQFYLSLLSSPEEQQKFTVVYRRYKQVLYRAALKLTKNPQDAEDLVHEAFIRLTGNLQKIHDLDSQETRSYLVTIVKNLALSMLEKKKRRAVFTQRPSRKEEYAEDEPRDPTALPGERAEQAEMLAALRRSVLRLTPIQQEILQLYYIEEKKAPEVSKVLNISENTVYKRLETARRALRREMEEEGYDGFEW